MSGFMRISVQKAHEIMGAGSVTVVDLRDDASFARGHIQRARILNEKNIEAFLRETEKEIPLICYCYHGISSQQAAGFFAGQGFKQVYSIDGGWEEWKGFYG